MNSKTQITTHMEYLGYDVKPSKDDDNVLFCFKSGYAALMIGWNDVRINIYAHYEINRIAKRNPDKVLKYINDLNSKSGIVTFWVQDELFRISSNCAGKYERSTFATFFSAFEYDANNLLDLSSETNLYLGDADQAENYIRDTRTGATA